MRLTQATDHSGPSTRRLIPTWVRLATLAACAIVLSACNVELFNNLDQRQANDIVATLFRQGIPAERVMGKAGRFTVNVDSSSFAQAVAILNESGLPKQEYASMCEVFKKDGIVQSPVAERAQMMCALGQELSRTVSEIDGVLSARVHLVLPENDPLRQQLVPSSASVFIRYQKGAQINDLIPQVKQLVANGVAGLSYDKVSVTPLPVEVRHTATAGEMSPDMSNVMGVWVHGKSAARASVLIYGLLLALIAAVGALAYVVWNPRNPIYPLQSGKAKTS